MAETVGQHSVAAFTSPVNGTTPIDANSVRGNDNTMRSAYVDHDADPGIHVQSSTLASRPVAGTAGRKWITVSSGRYQLWYDDGSRWHEVASDAVNVDCLADANLAKGDVIKITGFNNGQNLPTVNKVTSSTDVAFGLVENTVTSGNIVQIVNTGLIEDVDTNGYAVGTILYPNTSGAWTTTKPTSGNYQPAGYVLRGNTNNGVLYVEFSAPRIVERSDNTASTIVLRDASGNFSAGTITAGALTSTGLVTFASLKGTGATTVTNILDEDNMASDSATALATQQSIKAYVDAQVATVDTLAEVLANGNTTGANNIIVTNGQKITTNTIDETTAAAGVTIDSVLLKDDVVNATDIEVDTISANNGTLAVTLGSTGVATIAQQPILSSLTASQAVFTDASKGLVSNAITGTGNVVMSASPTLTGTVTAATINATTLGGTLSTAAQPNVTSLGTLSSLAVTGNLTLGADVVLSRGAADRLDLASGDSLNVVSGTYKIAGTDVLSSNTLGSGVTASSLTSVGTLTSLTVSGDLTVDTNVLKVDSSANNVIVGATSTTAKLAVANNSNDGTSDSRQYGIFGTAATYLGSDAAGIWGGGLGEVQIHNGTATRPAMLSLGGSLNAAEGLGTINFFRSGNEAGYRSRAQILSVGTNTGTANRHGGDLRFYTAADGATNPTERLRIDTSGNLGLGVTPSAWADSRAFQIANTSASPIIGGVYALENNGQGLVSNAYYDGTNWKYIYGSSFEAARYELNSGQHRWFYAAAGTSPNTASFTQAMTLDASGNLGLGTTSLNLSGGSAGTQVMTISGSASGRNGILELNGTRTTSGDYTGYVRFFNNGAATPLADIQAIRGSSDTTGVLAFATSNTERARITSGGYFKASNNGAYHGSTASYHELYSSTDNNAAVVIKSTGTSGTQYGVAILTTNDQNNNANYFLTCAGGANQTERATILSNGGLQNYSANNVNLASDFRLKKDIAPLASTWDKLKAIEVVNFRYKDCNEGDPALYGVIAQQVQPIVPELVIVTSEAVEAKDAELDEDGNEVKPAVEATPEYYGIREQPMYWLAIKALQEAQARIEALEARLEALEA